MSLTNPRQSGKRFFWNDPGTEGISNMLTQNLIEWNSLRSRDVTSSSTTAHGFDQNLWYHFFKPSNVDD